MRKFYLLLLIILIAVPLYFSFTQNYDQGKYLVIYNNNAYYSYPISLKNGQVIYLPDSVIFETIYIPHVIDYEIHPKNETKLIDIYQANINKSVIVYDKFNNKFTGKLLKYDGKVYLEVNNSLLILFPTNILFEEQNLKSNKNYIKAFVNFPVKSRISYLFSDISWHPVYYLNLDQNNAYLSLQALIRNNVDYFKKVNLSLIYSYDQIYPTRTQIQPKLLVEENSIINNNIEDKYVFNFGIVNLTKGEVKKVIFEKYLPIAKYYTLDLSRTSKFSHANVLYELKNSIMNLPGGQVYIYSNNCYLGESYISPTSKGNKLYISLGQSYDVFINQTLLDETVLFYDKKQSYVSRDYSVKIVNQGDSEAKVKLFYHLNKKWSISGIDYEKIDAHTVLFYFELPKNSSKVFSFNVKDYAYFSE